MRDRILEIVLLLIDFMQQNRGAVSDIDDISSALEMEGFSEREISAAYSWLVKRYGSWPECLYERFPSTHLSNRVLTAVERRRLTPDAHGFQIINTNSTTAASAKAGIISFLNPRVNVTTLGVKVLFFVLSDGVVGKLFSISDANKWA